MDGFKRFTRGVLDWVLFRRRVLPMITYDQRF